MFDIGRTAVLPIQLGFIAPSEPDTQIGILVVTGDVRMALGNISKNQGNLSGFVRMKFRFDRPFHFIYSR